MENSFFEFRDSTFNETGIGSDSDDDNVIDNSAIDESFSITKKPGLKNQTVYIAESDDYTSDEPENDQNQVNAGRKSSYFSQKKNTSDEDVSSNGSIRKGVDKHYVIESSSDENDVSPEIVPRRPPSKASTSKYSTESPIVRKGKRRMILTDSETDNSFNLDRSLKGHSKKQQCNQDTPQVFKNKNNKNKIEPINMSMGSCKEGGEITDDESPNEDLESPNDDDEQHQDSEEYGPDEFEMTMSRATRMSIMGPGRRLDDDDDDSDESDLIASDESNRASRQSLRGSTNSITSLPDAGFTNQNHDYQDFSNTKERPIHNDKTLQIDDQSPIHHDKTIEYNLDESNISCSTFGSPNVSVHSEPYAIVDSDSPVLSGKNVKQEIDEDVRIISEPIEVIDLSSESEEEYGRQSRKSKSKSKSPSRDKSPKSRSSRDKSPKSRNSRDKSPNSRDKSPRSYKKSPKTHASLDVEYIDSAPPNGLGNKGIPDMKKYLNTKPGSYPNSSVIHVKQKVKEQETEKLNKLRGELQNAKLLLDTMDVSTLPDGGVKLMMRLSALEKDVRAQAEKVANMIVEPDKVGEPSWEDLQKASHQVQPRQFGKQAMATHMAERNLILSRLQSLCESLKSRPSDTKEATPPSGLKSTLMPHQLQALVWLQWRETQQPRGGILADDMGLGKTITMIALVLSSKEGKDKHISDDEDERDENSPWKEKSKTKLVKGGTLVVCPASLVNQWEAEVLTHCGRGVLTVSAHHGANRDTRPGSIARYHICITTYNLLQRDKERNGPLFRINWSRIILDEAHVVRNHKSLTSTAVSALTATSRWCLTGTPVQNKDLDVFALIKFLKCTPFDDLQMWKKWIDNKSEGGYERMSTIMRCLLLRRTKAQLQEKGQLKCLPSRELHQIPVTLSTEEMNVYQKVLVFSKTLFAQFLHQRAEKQASGGFGQTTGKNNPYEKMHKRMVALQGARPVKSHEILVLLLRLRQVCCHCGLIAAMLDSGDHNGDEDQGSVDLLQELNKMTLEDQKMDEKNTSLDGGPIPKEDALSVDEAIKSVLSVNNPVFNLKTISSKIKCVMETLREKVFVHKGDKAVVVSQWTSVLSLVEKELDKDRIKCVTLSGQVQVSARAKLIEQINDPGSNVKVMLLSLCAGGVGLNLCGANHLLLLDPHWNPQLEEQAQDRIFRVGQKKAVNIYRFVCVDTVEQSIRNLQQDKLALADSVLTGAKNANLGKLSMEDLKGLFNMGNS